jgi:hypothetical protein
MFAIGAETRAVGVVVELDEFGSPPDKHRKFRSECDPHGRAQALRPCVDGAQRRLRPVEFPDASRHFARRVQECSIIFGAEDVRIHVYKGR